MAILTMDDVITGLTSAQILSFYKSAATTKGAGYYHSLWFQAGQPAAGATPATGVGETPSDSTTGAMTFTNAAGGNTMYLGRASLSANVAGHYSLYDRLWQVSGLSGTSTSGQAVNSTALTRHTDGIGVQLWVEWITATGSSAANLTVSYTNTEDTAGRETTIAFFQSPVAYQCQRVPLAAGDLGIKSVQTATLSGSTGTAGNWGFFMAYPLADFPMVTANAGYVNDAISCGLPIIKDDSALAWVMLCSASTQGPMAGQLNLIQG